MLRGLLGSGGKHLGSSSTQSLNALEEFTQIEEAMAAISHIMNDDVDAADEALNKGSSPFHLLGKGVINFIRATLGFEQDIMREASEALGSAETSAYDHQRRANKTPHTYRSPIYPPGTEYAVCLAEAQLMSAIVGVLNESLTESVKGFYKLRKAYLTLQGIMDAEQKYAKERSTSSLGSKSSSGSKPSSRPVSRLSGNPPRDSLSTSVDKAQYQSLSNATPSLSKEANQEEMATEHESTPDDVSEEFFDADEDQSEAVTPSEYRGHIAVPTEEGKTLEIDNSKRDIDLASSTAPDVPSEPPPPYNRTPSPIEDFEKLTVSDTVREGQDLSVYGDHPIDLFILSGSNFCFGILSLMISLVPPAFATVLKIVGFKGDRERGIQMLWTASKFHNFHGAMAGLVLFGFYNGLTGFCDIVPQSGEGSYPKARCKALLGDMRQRYPDSSMWLIEEARMRATEKQLEAAVEFMADCPKSPLKQLEALKLFEMSLNTMYMHDYEGTSKSFERCADLNNWSHGLYYYIRASAYVELYRLSKDKDPAEAKKHKETATELYKKVPQNTGRKRFMARQLPFDVFVNRKLQKWEERAKEWNCELIDAVGISPIEEMIYFWNGYKRMREDHLTNSMERLAWSESSANPHWNKEGLDERGVLALLRGAVLRNLGKTSEAKDLLNKEIIGHDRTLFKGHLKDSWTAPVARYEMAASIWREAERDGRPEKHMDMLRECGRWLEEVAKWESYDLDARIGMKVTTAKGTLRRYGIALP